MKLNYDDIQKAIEDTEREAFDYFLDKVTGELVILSQDIIVRTWEILSESYDDIADYDDVEPDVVPEVPDWMEEEIELAIEIFLDEKDHYIRIPERNPAMTFRAMKEFTETLSNASLKDHLMGLLEGPGAFRRFKDALAPYPKERKLWHGFNAKTAKKEIDDFLLNCGLPVPLD